MSLMPTKRCSVCKLPKDVNKFSTGEWKRAGNSRICRSCVQERSKVRHHGLRGWKDNSLVFTAESA
jgi:superfamily II helicase